MLSTTLLLAIFLTTWLGATAPIDPVARCRSLGELSLLGDDEAYLAQTKRRLKSPCELYHTAMAGVRLFDEKKDSALLHRARSIFAKMEQDLSASSEPEHLALRDWVAFRRAELAWRLRDARAADVLTPLTPEFPLRERAFLLGETLRGFSEPKLAFASLQQKTLPKGRLRLMQLQSLLSFGRGDVAAAQDLSKWERELWAEYPDAWGTPSKIAAPTYDEVDARFSVWHNRHANAEVLAQSAVMMRGALDAATRCRLLYYRGAAYRKLRNYAVSERTLSEAMQTCRTAIAAGHAVEKSEDALKRAWFLLVQVVVIARPFAMAKEAGEAFAAAYPSDVLTDDVLVLLAQSASKAKDEVSARGFLARVVAEHPAGDFCAEASFRMAYASYREGDYEGAANQLAAALPCDMDVSQKARASYWHSRALSRLKVPQGQVDEPLLAVLQLAPMSYYGVLARLRLGREKSDASAASQPASAPSAEPLFAERIRALSRLGLFSEAQQELVELEAQASDPILLCSLYCDAFDYFRAHRPFRKTLAGILGPMPSPASDALWRLAYPTPFSEVMRKAEKGERLPADLLVSLVREESAFRLDAGSWANAYGLTQLLVSTAVATASDMNYAKKVDADALRQPHISLALGAHHLNMLQKKLRMVPLILAGYNAGEKAVSHWIKVRGSLPLDEFIEEIPLDETRGYVKRILSTWTIYRHLGGRELPVFDLGPVNRRKG